MVDTKRIEAAVKQILVAIGEDPTRDGLKGTPARVARLWKEFADYKPGKIETSFAAADDRSDGGRLRYRRLDLLRAPPFAVPSQGRDRLHPERQRFSVCRSSAGSFIWSVIGSRFRNA